MLYRHGLISSIYHEAPWKHRPTIQFNVADDVDIDIDIDIPLHTMEQSHDVFYN